MMTTARKNHSAAVTLGLFASAAVLGLACGNKEPQPPPPPPGPDVVTMPTMSVSSEPPPVVEAPKPPPAPPIEFVEGAAAEAPAKAPTIAIKAPAKDQVIAADKANDFEVKLDLKGWDLTGGNHVHLIIDNKPYKRIDDPKQPIKLKDIDPNYTLGEGQHVLVAFPSRHTHESVKPVGKAAPLAVVPFWIGKKGEVKWKPTDPTLIYSRPKGANNGPAPAEGVLVDFYVANAELADGEFSIEALLKGPGADEGKKLAVKKWSPLRIKNVQSGTYSLSLKLLDKDGKQVPGAWNDTTREFTVDLAAPADPHPAPAPAGSAAPAGSGSAAPAKSPPPIKKKLSPHGRPEPRRPPVCGACAFCALRTRDRPRRDHARLARRSVSRNDRRRRQGARVAPVHGDGQVHCRSRSAGDRAGGGRAAVRRGWTELPGCELVLVGGFAGAPAPAVGRGGEAPGRLVAALLAGRHHPRARGLARRGDRQRRAEGAHAGLLQRRWLDGGRGRTEDGGAVFRADG